ncbi:MAG: thiamine diphosphokinase [Candidatus Stygibacter australis]|nr:thiamine diphosphokinase [Candidatus Stygibacter australis]MDP8323136.1 thiamine diphosphokinase [Candidatus Stygibacter australis]
MSNEKSICIIANGEKPDLSVLVRALSGVDLVIAADGGSNHCLDLRITPDVIIGDLDSAAPNIDKIFPKAEIIHLPDQDTSDMEKAVNYALGYKPDRINIISALGLRADHMLQNILIFYHFNQLKPLNEVEICLYDNWGKMKFLAPGSHTIRNKKGRAVSFFSFGSISNLTLKGFRYNLDNQKSQGYFGGLSNVYESDECLVEFDGSRMIWYECYEAKGESVDE